MALYHMAFGLAVALVAICISTTEGVCPYGPGSQRCLVTNAGGAFRKRLLDTLLKRDDTANLGDMSLKRALELLLAEEMADEEERYPPEEGKEEQKRQPPVEKKEQDRQPPVENEEQEEQAPPVKKEQVRQRPPTKTEQERYSAGFNEKERDEKERDEKIRELLELLLDE